MFRLFISLFLLPLNNPAKQWIIEKHSAFSLYYKKDDKKQKKEYLQLVSNGFNAVQSFVNGTFKKKFDIYIHPNRGSLEIQWRKDWNMPGFKSECWMVASGVALKLDLIAPMAWDKETCEHSYSNKIKTQQVITHELFHVYHGQLNISPDFSDTENIDWFVEGFATYASGQCDKDRIAEIKKAVAGNLQPKSLNDFWKGKLRYGLSGSLVKYIDEKYGRVTLNGLLPFNKKASILGSLGISEDAFLAGWQKYIVDLEIL